MGKMSKKDKKEARARAKEWADKRRQSRASAAKAEGGKRAASKSPHGGRRALGASGVDNTTVALSAMTPTRRLRQGTKSQTAKSRSNTPSFSLRRPGRRSLGGRGARPPAGGKENGRVDIPLPADSEDDESDGSDESADDRSGPRSPPGARDSGVRTRPTVDVAVQTDADETEEPKTLPCTSTGSFSSSQIEDGSCDSEWPLVINRKLHFLVERDGNLLENGHEFESSDVASALSNQKKEEGSVEDKSSGDEESVSGAVSSERIGQGGRKSPGIDDDGLDLTGEGEIVSTPEGEVAEAEEAKTDLVGAPEDEAAEEVEDKEFPHSGSAASALENAGIESPSCLGSTSPSIMPASVEGEGLLLKDAPSSSVPEPGTSKNDGSGLKGTSLQVPKAVLCSACCGKGDGSDSEDLMSVLSDQMDRDSIEGGPGGIPPELIKQVEIDELTDIAMNLGSASELREQQLVRPKNSREPEKSLSTPKSAGSASRTSSLVTLDLAGDSNGRINDAPSPSVIGPGVSGNKTADFAASWLSQVGKEGGLAIDPSHGESCVQSVGQAMESLTSTSPDQTGGEAPIEDGARESLPSELITQGDIKSQGDLQSIEDGVFQEEEYGKPNIETAEGVGSRSCENSLSSSLMVMESADDVDGTDSLHDDQWEIVQKGDLMSEALIPAKMDCAALLRYKFKTLQNKITRIGMIQVGNVCAKLQNYSGSIAEGSVHCDKCSELHKRLLKLEREVFGTPPTGFELGAGSGCIER